MLWMNKDGDTKSNLEAWKEEAGYRVTPACAAKGCTNNATHGKQVRKVNSPDRTAYILPLCDTCGKEPGPYTKKTTVEAIPKKP